MRMVRAWSAMARVMAWRIPGRELVGALVLELVHRLHEADVVLLDEVQKLQAAVRVLLGDRDHEAEVGIDELLLRLLGLGLPDDGHPERLPAPPPTESPATLPAGEGTDSHPVTGVGGPGRDHGATNPRGFRPD